MTSMQKKRAVVSFENMPKELAAAFAEKYPRGFSDYLSDLQRYDKPDGTSFYAVGIEIPEAIYLVKIKVKTDDIDEVERWLDEGVDDMSNSSASEDSSSELPDDNISQYGSSEEDN